VKGSEWYY